ncbi:MAG: hypothetical protein C4524_08715 [Candidatus Zixiibacteriota bacterium]|nr:MAG: hypothetical protein C4524_08715 [candidate division Zixibacteria bacterium]
MNVPPSFWYGFYNLVCIPLLYVGMQVARIFTPKVREGIRGRVGLFRRLAQARDALEPGRRFVVIHCASAGEFEAARPLLGALKKRLPHLKAHVTCYSPSGLKPLSRAAEVESYSYLPFDDRRSVRRFLDLLDPAAVLFIKHDVWPNMVWAAQARGLPALWVNANLHSHTRRLSFPFQGMNRAFLDRLSAILTVGDDHALRLSRLVNPGVIEVTGDSRYDRTLERMAGAASPAQHLPEAWSQGRRVIVGGSTWGPDQRILVPAFARLKSDFPDLRLLLVPHEPGEEFLTDTAAYLEAYGLTHARLTRLNGTSPDAEVLVVDKVGILAALYRSAWAAYVGGAFGHGVHSVLEPAVFHLPLFFGPKHYMSHEAGALIQRGGAWEVGSPADLEARLRLLLHDEQAWKRAAEASGGLVQNGAGATDRILDRLERLLATDRTDRQG